MRVDDPVRGWFFYYCLCEDKIYFFIVLSSCPNTPVNFPNVTIVDFVWNMKLKYHNNVLDCDKCEVRYWWLDLHIWSMQKFTFMVLRTQIPIDYVLFHLCPQVVTYCASWRTYQSVYNFWFSSVLTADILDKRNHVFSEPQAMFTPRVLKNPKYKNVPSKLTQTKHFRWATMSVSLYLDFITAGWCNEIHQLNFGVPQPF